MEETIETRVSAEKIWQAWEAAHANQGEGSTKGLKYKIVDIVKGERFSLVWKTLFVRLIFTHSVTPKKRGSEIKFSVQIGGPFAIPVRWLLGNKIRTNIRQVLKTMVKRLET